jgi:apolipoprotein D and lipocalin family protein
MYQKVYFGIILILIIPFMFSCSTIPKGAQPVQHFNKERYLGKWYEIARMDFRFEKNLINTTAEYSLRTDGKIKVVNRGFSTTKNKNKTATGKAVLRGSSEAGALKVSFFGPFYAAYNVIAIDENYQYALVAGKNLRYLWLLSREKTMPDNVKKDYLQKAQAVGYNTDQLVWVKQD